MSSSSNRVLSILLVLGLIAVVIGAFLRGVSTPDVTPTPSPTITLLPTVAETETETPTAAASEETPTETATEFPTGLPIETETPVELPTDTPSNEETATAISELPTDVPTDAPQETVENTAIAELPTDVPTEETPVSELPTETPTDAPTVTGEPITLEPETATPDFLTPTQEVFETATDEGGVALAGVFAAAPNLSVQGVQLTNPDGTRFIVSGINVELFRDPGCSNYTTAAYSQRKVIAPYLKSQNINLVRLNYSYSWLNQGTNLSQFLDFAAELAGQQIYFMPSDHTFTGKPLTGLTATLALWTKIIDGAKARGIDQWLVVNPYNEPYSSPDWANWIAAQKTILNHIRGAGLWSGVVVLDGPTWAASFDVNSFKAVQAHDATLLGAPNLVFTNHWYPNINLSNVQNQANNANVVPVLIGEIGQENPGSSPTVPQYVRDTINIVLAALPRGHNGLIAWIYSWCDINSQTSWGESNFPNYTAWNTYGKLYADLYYSKLPTGQPGTLIPSGTPVPPLATKTRTPTLRPSATLTRTATATPSLTPTPTLTATLENTLTPTPLCDELQTGWIGGEYVYLCTHYAVATPE